jgi:hypothetical protein
MATIVEYIIGPESDMQLLLGNGSVARSANVLLSGDWTTIRIAVRMTVEDTGANLTGAPQFLVGLCAGYNYLYGSNSCRNFVGVGTNQGTWSRSTTTSTNYGLTSGLFATAKVGTTITRNSTSLNNSSTCVISAVQSVRWGFSVDITKGTPNYTLGSLRVNAVSTTDVTKVAFINGMEQTTPVLANHAVATPRAVAVDEATNGRLDHVCLSWDRDANKFHISDVLVVRIA